VKEIGQGGFGTVYLCEDFTGAGKKVAIKEIPKV
jgi:serine/threonine protein kinase